MPLFSITNLILIFSACFASYLLFPLANRLSVSFGALDAPSPRKIHKTLTPRAGGICFFLPFLIFLPLLGISALSKLFLLVGSTVIFLIGLLDDVISLSPWQKLTGQALAASIPIFLGLNLYSKGNVLLYALFGALTFLWVLLLTNSINLSDGLDCLATGEGISFSLSLALFSFVLGKADVFYVSLLLSSCLIGFVPHNRHPAKIFMGDCGSLFLGFCLSVLSVLCFSGTSARTAWAMLVLFFLPLSDTLQSFLRRVAHGKNPFSADKGHFHHRLLNVGFSHSTALLLLCALSLLFSFTAELLLFL